jgi:hypothetical protein
LPYLNLPEKKHSSTEKKPLLPIDDFSPVCESMDAKRQSHIMTPTTTDNANANAYGLGYWIVQTLQTRRFGHTYVHSKARQQAEFSSRAFEHDGIIFSYTGWGRSLNTGGHKYKVHARYSETGKPVPSKVLRAL